MGGGGGGPSAAAGHGPSGAESAADCGAARADGVVLELPLFSCREAYVYKVPPASTAGHRAELWDVNKWVQEVAVRVVAQGDECFVRLEEQETGAEGGGGDASAGSGRGERRAAACAHLGRPQPPPGELFAEAPIPADKPLVTAVEPVLDSSRYFVLKLVDRASQRHAFMGACREQQSMHARARAPAPRRHHRCPPTHTPLRPLAQALAFARVSRPATLTPRWWSTCRA